MGFTFTVLVSNEETNEEAHDMEISSSFHDIVTVESKMQEKVDANHPFVEDLVSAGYTVEQSIYAVEKCGALDTAMEYLHQKDDDDGKELLPFSPRGAKKPEDNTLTKDGTQ